MEITIQKKFLFIPEWNGNKDEENPIEITGELLTNEKIERCWSIGSEMKIDRDKYIKYSKIIIKNLTVGGKAITTGDALLSAWGLGGLYNELATFLIEINNREPGKNSLQPST